MGRITVAICDANEDYRERFAAYLVEHKAETYRVYAFSEAAHFLKAMERQSFDAAVLGQGFAEVQTEVRQRQIPFVLLEETESAGMQGDTDSRTGKMCVSVFRYQPIEAILHEVQVLTCTESEISERLRRRGTRLECIGVYSPMGHEMQMPFTLVLAEMLAQTRKVLYVNLMRYSGFAQLLGVTEQYDLGDLVLRLRNQRLQVEAFRKCVYEREGVDYIPPFRNPENLDDFTEEDFRAFLCFLEKETDFDVVVFDFGDGACRLSELLSECTSVYCPVKMGFFYECRTKQFLEFLERAEKKELQDLLQIINLPFSAKQIRGGDVCKQLLWSTFGDYVRSSIFGGET